MNSLKNYSYISFFNLDCSHADRKEIEIKEYYQYNSISDGSDALNWNKDEFNMRGISLFTMNPPRLFYSKNFSSPYHRFFSK